jgi:hypothetical protein
MIDTQRAVEIKASPVKMLGLAVLGCLMTAASAALARRVLPNISSDSVDVWIFYGATAFFGSCTVLILWRAFTTRGPVVTITREGIRDRRIAAEVIPWSAVNDITIWEMSGQRVMVLAVAPAVEAKLTLTRMARWTRGANRALGADGLCVSAQGLRMGFNKLLATSIAYARAWRANASAA